MNYYELLFTTIVTGDYQQDMLINALGDIGFETFEEMDLGFKAYIPSEKFDSDVLDETLEIYREMFTFSYDISLVPYKNWNEVWESNFEPIFIKNTIYVRATFHEPKPEFAYEIIIDPKMAFGTGHHQTTSMMLEMLVENDIKGKVVLDMGCGTGILAIMASMAGAARITAIDFDAICFHSTIENLQQNKIINVQTLNGSKEAIPDEHYDVILANINRNILIDQIQRYSEVLTTDGELYMSGFYETPDLDIIIEEARKYGIKYIIHKVNNGWVAAKFIK